MGKITFTDEFASFELKNDAFYKTLYFPIASEKGLKSVVTPTLGGDAKLDQNSFILEPVSVENLHNNKSGRNFFCLFEDGSFWSAVGKSAEEEYFKYSDKGDKTSLKAGLLWQSTDRTSKKYGLEASVTSFVPYNANMEIMYVELKNISQNPITFTPVAAIPIYGRSADNLRDHRHVTSLLHRIEVTKDGVLVKPTLSFDERGHSKNKLTYYVYGHDGEGNKPEAFYPTVDEFIGDDGSFTAPEALIFNKPGVKEPDKRAGKEAMGGLRFTKLTLNPGQRKSYIVLMGIDRNKETIDEVISLYENEAAVNKAFKENSNHWNEKVNIQIHTGDDTFDNYFRWVTAQPELRRIYGCSFLPYHDYGKGGRGWRDLWQDCLALLMMDPCGVKEMILNNFAGVRADGTNATIIGSKPGEFIADRNGITRVWMDHGMWPFKTVELYMEQSGDLEILTCQTPYFKDRILMRGTETSKENAETCNTKLLCQDGTVYYGSVLEHMLLEHIMAAFERGSSGSLKLRGADWNDALDMASENGESVAFTAAYAGNILKLSEYVKALFKKNQSSKLVLMAELTDMVESCLKGESRYEAYMKFLKAVSYNFSGKKKETDINLLADFLKELGEEMMDHIRGSEWIEFNDNTGWFNSYYDNHGRKVEGLVNGGVRMMLTGQVFTVMSGTATDSQVKKIVNAADEFLFDKSIGGYRLNTNFNEEKYDMGRAFGFAYGEKENGAVFSHMAVMYAYALYKRGFVKEGYKALKALLDTAADYETSRIYPGIPEYFNNEGRGMYHYLTGAASWYILTLITESFGVRGEKGNLVIEPKLLKEQFNEKKSATVELTFASKKFKVEFLNRNNKEYGEYKLESCLSDEEINIKTADGKAMILREDIEKLDGSKHVIRAVLG